MDVTIENRSKGKTKGKEGQAEEEKKGRKRWTVDARNRENDGETSKRSSKRFRLCSSLLFA